MLKPAVVVVVVLIQCINSKAKLYQIEGKNQTKTKLKILN